MNYKFTPRQARTYAGLTLEGLSKLMGVSRQSVCDWESGKTKMSIPVINMLAKVTGIAVDDIFLQN